jgi:hypothetical protein
MSTLDDWIVDACDALGLPGNSLPRDLRDGLLDLTKDVAHGVARPAGPLTTFLVGLAVAGGTAPSTAIDRLTQLAGTRAAEQEQQDRAAERQQAAEGGPDVAGST